ncbi:MAG: hypothetical protein H8E35_05815 [Ardenticatenia bacterium]|nr:hypothetical protein [Ardenticatenia bacterium]
MDPIREAQPLGGDKAGIIVLNCYRNVLDWYIEEPRSEYRLVAKIPAYHDDHCTVSHLEPILAAPVPHMFGFLSEGVQGTTMSKMFQIPAGQVGVLGVDFDEFADSGKTVSELFILGTLADLQDAVAPYYE